MIFHFAASRLTAKSLARITGLAFGYSPDRLLIGGLDLVISPKTGFAWWAKQGR
ncbi:MAG: hypothetical protein R2874_01200 [Desulfobacterales bacterium]